VEGRPGNRQVSNVGWRAVEETRPRFGLVTEIHTYAARLRSGRESLASGIPTPPKEGKGDIVDYRPNKSLQQTPAAFRLVVLQRLSSGRRC